MDDNNNNSTETGNNTRQDHPQQQAFFRILVHYQLPRGANPTDGGNNSGSFFGGSQESTIIFAFPAGPPPPKPHASKKAIDSLQDVDYDSIPESDRTCSICLEPYEKPIKHQETLNEGVSKVDDESSSNTDGEGQLPPPPPPTEPAQSKHTPVRMPCGHTFGRSCLLEWLSGSTTCPMCRTPVEGEQPTASTSEGDNSQQQQQQQQQTRWSMFVSPVIDVEFLTSGRNEQQQQQQQNEESSNDAQEPSTNQYPSAANILDSIISAGLNGNSNLNNNITSEPTSTEGPIEPSGAPTIIPVSSDPGPDSWPSFLGPRPSSSSSASEPVLGPSRSESSTPAPPISVVNSGRRHHPYARPQSQLSPGSASYASPSSDLNRADLSCANAPLGLCGAEEEEEEEDNNGQQQQHHQRLVRLSCGHGYHADCLSRDMHAHGDSNVPDFTSAESCPEAWCLRCRRYRQVIGL